MNLLGRNTVATDVLVDRLTMFLIVAEGIEDLGECEVRQPPDDFFWRDAKFPQLGNGPYRRAGAGHDGGSVKNLVGADNVGMARGRGHPRGLLRGGDTAAKPTGGRRRSQFSLTTIGTTPTASIR
jgi:hypothetical protein